MDRYSKLMPKSEHRRLMAELTAKHYSTPTSVPVVNIVPTSKANRVRVTKSPATLVAEGQSIEVKNTLPTVTESPVVNEVKPEPKPVVNVQSGSVKIPKSVAAIIGTTVNNIQVISFNETESLTPRGQNNKQLPHVNCHCIPCGNDFVMNAYWITGGQKKDCGCTSKRKG